MLLFACVSISTWVIARADAQSVQLTRQGGTDQINPLDEQLSRFMKWSHGGFFIADGLSGEPPIFYSLDRDGRWTDMARFRDEAGPTWFDVFDEDRETNGTIVFSGQTGSAEVSPFVAWTSADGKIQRTIRTGHYFPYKIAIAPDDTIWTLGLEHVNFDYEDPAVNKEAHVLRHFDNAGRTIGSAFPQSQFNRYQRFRLTTGLLVAGRDKLGWFGPRDRSPGYSATYTEISLDTMTMKDYPDPWDHPSGWEYVLGLAITNSGVVAMCVDEIGGDPYEVRTNYVLDRASSKWLPVSVPPMGGFKFTPVLIGSDGDNLVFKYGTEAGFFSVSQ